MEWPLWHTVSVIVILLYLSDNNYSALPTQTPVKYLYYSLSKAKIALIVEAARGEGELDRCISSWGG